MVAIRDLLAHVVARERNDGVAATCDKKTLLRLLETLQAMGKALVEELILPEGCLFQNHGVVKVAIHGIGEEAARRKALFLHALQGERESILEFAARSVGGEPVDGQMEEGQGQVITRKRRRKATLAAVKREKDLDAM